eukprot:gene29169-32391_t
MPNSKRNSIEAASPKYAVILAPELFSHSAEEPEKDLELEDLDFDRINGSWTWRREASRLAALSGPLIFQNLFGYLISVISALFVGRLGPAELAAVVLANSLYNVTGFSIICGLSAGMETLCGQAYGARQYKRIGLILQRATIICTIACVPVVLLWTNMEWVLVLMHQAPDVYMKIISPTLFSCTLSSVLYRYLLAQGIVQPSTWCTFIAALTCPIYNWLLIFKWGYGLDGAAYAFFLSMTTYTLALLVYVIAREMCMAGSPENMTTCKYAFLVYVIVREMCKAGSPEHMTTCKYAFLVYVIVREMCKAGSPESTWPGWQLVAAACDVRALMQYLSFGLPATAMICAEWWAYEAVIIFSGALPNADIAVSTMGICFHITSICYMVAYSFATATSTRVSNELGIGNAIAAGRVFRVSVQTVVGAGRVFRVSVQTVVGAGRLFRVSVQTVVGAGRVFRVSVQAVVGAGRVFRVSVQTVVGAGRVFRVSVQTVVGAGRVFRVSVQTVVGAGRVFRVSVQTVICNQSVFALLLFFNRNSLGVHFTASPEVLCTQSVFALLLFFNSNSLGLLFTDSPEVVAAVAVVAPIVSISLIGDGVNAVMAGVLRGCGRQMTGAVLNLIGFWVFGIPLSYMLAFKYNFAARGLWISLACVTSALGIAQLTYVFWLDWENEVTRAAINLKKGGEGQHGDGPSGYVGGSYENEDLLLRKPLLPSGSGEGQLISPGNSGGGGRDSGSGTGGVQGEGGSSSFRFTGSGSVNHDGTPKLVWTPPGTGGGTEPTPPEDV